MHFKHPLVLVALILIVLPIIVHLFQLQKYTKTPFTNVKFLKNIILKNRKSSKLKKLLVLISRIALFTFLILAFAEPYLSDKKASEKTNIIVFLDNSYSMQAKSKNLNLFSSAIQNLIKFSSTTFQENDTKITLLTNDQQFKNLSIGTFKEQISKLKLSAQPFSLDNTLLKIGNLARDSKAKTKAFIVSDFQINTDKPINKKLKENVDFNFIKLAHSNKTNISLDSVYISSKSATKLNLTVLIKNSHFTGKNISISLFNNNLLIAKSNTKLVENKSSKINFVIDNNTNFKGKLSIEDLSLKFDNTLYFTTNKPKTIRVLSIGKRNNSIRKLYSSSEFSFAQSKIESLDFTQINNQHLIVLNAVEIIPELLKKALVQFVESGGSLIVIPNINSALNSYTSLLRLLNRTVHIEKVTQNHKITTINYAHPLLNNVFEKEVTNFDYPSVKSYYKLTGKNVSSILKLDNNANFISQIPVKEGALYFVGSSLNTSITTFVNSPLIVPIFYNMALQGTVTNPLYYTLHQSNKIGINTTLKNDKVLSLNNTSVSFIPQQQIKQNRVILETNELPNKAGFYNLKKDTIKLKDLAFNIDRKESKLQFYNKKDLELNKNTHFYTNLNKALQSYKDTTSIFELWQICIILALLFFIIEILLLKHFTK
ncbi:MAG: BatA domain-containing protein [Flavobacteriaceae bacterium]